MMRDTLKADISNFISRMSSGQQAPEERDALIDKVCTWQRSKIPALQRWHALMSHDGDKNTALPTDAFRFGHIATFDQAHQNHVFRTSGTTSGKRGAHSMLNLQLYDQGPKAAAKFGLFPDRDAIDMLILAPAPQEASDSSLSYMLGRFTEWFGASCTWFVKDKKLDIPAFMSALERAASSSRPVAVLGTSFAFVNIEDAISQRFVLPPGSRIMHTGGFKGRSRIVDPATLRRMLATRYGVAEPFVMREYGMTEMSSQLYEWSLRDALAGDTPRHSYWIPAWVRISEVPLATFFGDKPVHADGPTVLRIDDLANLDSICALQTMDQGRVQGDTLDLFGRLRTATPRGCSLSALEWEIRA